MPLSNRPAARERQLANLNPRPPAPPPGNQRARKHGGYAQVAEARLDDKAREVYVALAADAPVRDAAGELPAADAVAVRLLAECLCRLDDVAANVRQFGIFDQDSGEVRPVVELERRLRGEARDHAADLGMTPAGRAKLGLDLARTESLAATWARQAAEELDTVDGEARDA